MNGLLLASSHENKDIKFNPKNLLDTKDDLMRTKQDFFQNLMENLLHDIPEGKNRDFLIAQVLDLPENIAKSEDIHSSFAKEPLFKEHQIDKVSIESLLELVALLRQHPNEPLTDFPTDSGILKTALLNLSVQQEFKEAKTIGDLLHLAKKHHIKVKNMTFFKEETALDPKTKKMIKAVKSEEIFKLITEKKQTLHSGKEARNSDILKKLLIPKKNDQNEIKSVQTKTTFHQSSSVSKSDTILSGEKNDSSLKSHQKEKSPTNSDKITLKEYFNHHAQPSKTDTREKLQITSVKSIQEEDYTDNEKNDSSLKSHQKEKSPTNSDKTTLKEHFNNHIQPSKTDTRTMTDSMQKMKSEKAFTPLQTTSNQNTQNISVHERAAQSHIDQSSLQRTVPDQNIKEALTINNHNPKSHTLKKGAKDLSVKESPKIEAAQSSGSIMDTKIHTAIQQINISGTPATPENPRNSTHITVSEPSKNIQDRENTTSIEEEEHSFHEDKTTVSHETKTTSVQQTKIKQPEFKHTLNTFARDFKEQVENYKAPLMKIKMQLNPGNLGDVDVTLVNRGSHLHVTINSNPSTIAIFTQNQTEFKNSLVNMGFTGLQMSFGESKDQGRGQNYKQTGKQGEKDSQEIHETDHFEMIVPRYV